MSDLISRQVAIDGLDSHYVERRNLNEWQAGWNSALEWMQGTYLDELPSAQPERKTGWWEDNVCSECGYGVEPWNNTRYCPNCGAKMEVEHERHDIPR